MEKLKYEMIYLHIISEQEKDGFGAKDNVSSTPAGRNNVTMTET